MHPNLSKDLEFAHQLAAVAAEISLSSKQDNIGKTVKADGSPVTAADLAIEQAMIEFIHQHRPNDGVFGEETGTHKDSDRTWLIDPIDGTFNYIADNPQWGNHIALLRNDEVILGVITRPEQNEKWWASKGQGAYKVAFDDKPIRIQTSATAAIAKARVTAWAENENETIRSLKEQAGWLEPTMNSLLELAEGSVDAVVDYSGKPWDLAPYIILIEEAGGRYTGLEGGNTAAAIGGVFSNGLIHEELLAAMSSIRLPK